MKVGMKVKTPDGYGQIVEIEKFRLSTRYGVKHKSGGEILYYWEKELTKA